jgi:hypothetical protein
MNLLIYVIVQNFAISGLYIHMFCIEKRGQQKDYACHNLLIAIFMNTITDLLRKRFYFLCEPECPSSVQPVCQLDSHPADFIHEDDGSVFH